MSKRPIPESWVECTLGDLVEGFQYGINASSATAGDFQLLRITDLKSEGINWSLVPFVSLKKSEADKYILNDEDILVARSGSIGKIAILNRPPEKAVFASYLIRVKMRKQARLFPITKLYFSSPLFQEHILANAKGATQTNVNTDALRRSPFVIPPINEQKRIVAKIESTQSKIKTIEDSVSRAEELISKYREALLQKAFRGQLVPQNPNDEPASELIKRIQAERSQQQDGKKKKKPDLPPITPDEIPFEIPASWQWVRLGDITVSMDSGWSPDCKEVPAQVGQWGILKTTAVQLDCYNFEANKVLPKGLKPKPDKEVNIGDILITRAGPKNRVGIACLVKSTQEKLMISDKIVRLKLSVLVDADVVAMFLTSILARPLLEHLMTGMAESQVNISQEKFRHLLIPLPPNKIQKKIATELRSMQSKIPAVELQLKGISKTIIELKNSILNHAYLGNLVPQDPNEGTGHKLLEQIIRSQPETTKPLRKSIKKTRTKK